MAISDDCERASLQHNRRVSHEKHLRQNVDEQKLPDHPVFSFPDPKGSTQISRRPHHPAPARKSPVPRGCIIIAIHVHVLQRVRLNITWPQGISQNSIF